MKPPANEFLVEREKGGGKCVCETNPIALVHIHCHGDICPAHRFESKLKHLKTKLMMTNNNDISGIDRVDRENERRRQVHHNQLQAYRSRNDPSILTLDSGCPLANLNATKTAGPGGRVLLEDTALIEQLANFNREKTLSRPCFAKGTAAYGYFVCSDNSLSEEITNLSVFRRKGQETPVAVRFSKFLGELGGPDTTRDVLGMAVKFDSGCGCWDLICSSLPVFFVEDPIHFVSLKRALGRNPVTNLPDPDMKWDFLSQIEPAMHAMLMLHSERGIHEDYVHCNFYSVNTYKLVNVRGKTTYCRFQWKPTEGARFLDETRANQLALHSPDHYSSHLFNSISLGNLPRWKLCLQLLDDPSKLGFNPFDCTKVWPHAKCVTREVGELVLNRLPANYHGEVEQLCFSPANLIPGIEPSSDKILQARMFAYADSQRHRLGVNFAQIPCNKSHARCSSISRGGQMSIWNGGGTPAYFPNSFNGPRPAEISSQHEQTPLESLQGFAGRFSPPEGDDRLDQARVFYSKVLREQDKQIVAKNLAKDLALVQGFIKKRVFQVFNRISQDLVERVKRELGIENHGGVEKSVQT